MYFSMTSSANLTRKETKLGEVNWAGRPVEWPQLLKGALADQTQDPRSLACCLLRADKTLIFTSSDQHNLH